MSEYKEKIEIIKHEVRIRNGLARIVASEILTTIRSESQKIIEHTSRLFDAIISENEIKNEIKYEARTSNGLAKALITAASKTLNTEKAETTKESTKTESFLVIQTDSKPDNKQAIVKYEYQAKAGDELSLKIGEIITDITVVEEGWCKGKLNGSTGMFLENFVKFLREPPPRLLQKR